MLEEKVIQMNQQNERLKIKKEGRVKKDNGEEERTERDDEEVTTWEKSERSHQYLHPNSKI